MNPRRSSPIWTAAALSCVAMMITACPFSGSEQCFEFFDRDGDGVCDAVDNCPYDPNPAQSDSDADGVGDDCDVCKEQPDGPKRGSCKGDLSKSCDVTVSVVFGNWECGEDGPCVVSQVDTDEDGVGDLCGDNCISKYNPNQLDDDDDSVGNACDNCPVVENEDQLDSDEDGIGDACDPCPLVAGMICG